MKYFLSPSGSLFAFESDGSQDNLIPSNYVLATDAQVRDIQNPHLTLAPADLTPRQIRMALTRAGLRATVEDAVASGGQELKDWWEWSQTFERNHPAVIQMGAALGQTPEQMDALWALGATL